MIITSLAYCSYHHTLYRTTFTLGAQVQSSLGTNVNAPFFFQVPTLEFGHGAGAREQGRDLVPGHKSGNWVPVCTQFL